VKKVFKTLPAGVALAVAYLYAVTVHAAPQMLPKTSIEANCKQADSYHLDCDYRFTEPVPLYSVSATLDWLELPVPQQSAYPAPGDSSAVLFLVDTSDPARNEVVQENLRVIERFLADAKPHHAFGLATFDSNLELVAPIGSAPLDIARIARDIRASGKTTELYRNTIVAIRHLKRYPAQRKAVFLFSDGLAEDRAYHNDDAVKAARDAGVIIYGFGYPRSIPQTVALQTLRRLSEETGGRFAEAGLDLRLPDTVMREPFAMFDSGGNLSIDLSATAETDLSGQQTLRIGWETEGGIINTYSDVSLPARAPIAVVATAPERLAAPGAVGTRAEADAGANSAVRPDAFAQWLVYGVWSLAGLVALLIFIWALTFEVKRIRARRREQDDDKDRISYAFLEVLDGTGARHPVRTTAYRIGRHSENDLRLPDNTVSRHHAEILRRRDGTFSITDLDSINGVTVNDRSVKTAVLQEGDEIECGDIRMRFTLSRAGEPGEDETVLLKTKVPYLEAS